MLYVANLLLRKQSQAPEEFLPKTNGNKFFLDAAVERAVRALIRNQKYIGKIVTDGNSNNEGLICIEEKPPQTASSIAAYIVQLPSYTEMHCRMIFRQIVEIIKLCHDNGLAHRNLLFTSLLVDSRVCYFSCTS
jgi:serine/threonine protein kinase